MTADADAAIERLATAVNEYEAHHPLPPPPEGVALAYVHANDVSYSFHYSIFGLWTEDLRHHKRISRGGIIAIRTNAGQLTTARNRAVQYLLDSDAPWLMWVDTDMGFPPDIIERLLAAADPVERPIMGALCFSQRELAPDELGGYHTLPTPTIFDWVPAGDGEGEFGGFQVRFDYPPNEVVRCTGTGTAAILIHRSVFERIEAKYGREWYHRIPAADGAMGEDLSFCMRATALDIPIHVHTGVRTTHAKRVWISETDYLAASSVPSATEEVAVLVPVLGRPEHAAPLMASLRASTGLATCYAICDPTDVEAAAAWKEAGAVVIDGPDRGRPGSFAEKVNLGYRVTTEPWLLLAGSDVRFHPGWWDHAAFVAGDRYDVVGTNDLGNPRVLAGEHATHPLIRRSYIEQVGASWDGPGIVAHEGYGHWWVDEEVCQAAKDRGVFVAALASKVEHLHPLWGKGQVDPTYEQGQKHAETDRALYRKRLAEFGRP
jgi:glycosyltransferase involved in cell wall biosynthesis